jgi:hypothetical protein
MGLKAEQFPVRLRKVETVVVQVGGNHGAASWRRLND